MSKMVSSPTIEITYSGLENFIKLFRDSKVSGVYLRLLDNMVNSFVEHGYTEEEAKANTLHLFVESHFNE